MEYVALGQALSTAELAERFARVTAGDVRAVLELCPLTAPTVVALGPIKALH